MSTLFSFNSKINDYTLHITRGEDKLFKLQVIQSLSTNKRIELERNARLEGIDFADYLIKHRNDTEVASAITPFNLTNYNVKFAVRKYTRTNKIFTCTIEDKGIALVPTTGIVYVFIDKNKTKDMLNIATCYLFELELEHKTNKHKLTVATGELIMHPEIVYKGNDFKHFAWRG